MAKQRKQKQGGVGLAGEAADSGNEATVVVRHQKLCVAIDMEQERLTGHTELEVVPGKSNIVELHGCELDIIQVLVDGLPAKFELKQQTPNSSEQPSPRSQSVYSAADTAYSTYRAALEEESAPDLFISLPISSPVDGGNEIPLALESDNPNGDSQDPLEGTSKVSTIQKESARLIQVQYRLEKPKAKAYFTGNIFHTHNVQRWFPCLGSMLSRSSYHLEVTVNCDYVAVGPGNLLYQVVRKEDARMKTYVYDLEIPTCVSFITLIVAPLVVLPERPNARISHMCPPGYVSKLQSSVSCFQSLFSLYEEYLGSPFPFGCYKQVFLESQHLIPSVAIGASMVTLSSHLLVDERIIDQAIITQIKLAHALAQQWFGVFITPESDRDGWLLEGISGFLVHLFIKKFLGNNEAQFRKHKAIGAVTEADVDSAPPLSPSSFHPGAYRAEKLGFLRKIRLWKAVAVIQMLEKQMGADPFRKVLQRIVLRAQDPVRNLRTLSTKEFRHFANKIGNLERPFLKEFFPRWVESQGCPWLRMGFEYNKRRNIVELAVHRDCTAPGVVMPGKIEGKSIADVGWPGMMSIQIHELDGMYDHPNLSMSGDVYQLLELPCHSKLANRRPQRQKKAGKVEIIDDLADDKPSVESPLLWIRADPGMEYLAKIQLFQPENMWINQLEKDKDVVAQIQAITALQSFPNSFAIVNALSNCLIDSKVFCRARIEAAFALANTAAEATSWAGLAHLLKFYKSRCFDAEIGLPKSNNFQEFAEYFVLQAIPLAVAAVRGGQGGSPPEAVDFILNILKHNDNSGNAYSDSYWLSSIIEAAGELEVGQQSLSKFQRILKQIDRYLQYDRLMPSYNYIVTRSCIRTLTRLALKFTAILRMEPLEKLLSPFKNVQRTAWQVRLAALQALMDMKFKAHGLDATLCLAINFVHEDPSLKVQTKVMAYALSICIRKNTSSPGIDSSTLSSLLDMFGSEYCARNCYLRHHIFTILQVLARRPATLSRKGKPLLKGLLPVPSAFPENETNKESRETRAGREVKMVRREEALEPSKLKVRIQRPQDPVLEPLKFRVFSSTAAAASPTVKKDADQKVGKVKLRVKTNAMQNEGGMEDADRSMPNAAKNAALEVGTGTVKPDVENIECKLISPSQSQAEKAASPSNQVGNSVPATSGPDKMEIDQPNYDGSPQSKNLVEIIDMKPVVNDTDVQIVVPHGDVAGEPRKEKRDKKDKKEKKEKKDRDKKEKKEKKDKKEKKEKKHKDKKHKKDRHRHEEMKPENRDGTQNEKPQVLHEREAQAPNSLLQVKKEIAEANEVPVKAEASETVPPVIKRPGEGGFRLKIKRPKIE